MGDGRRQSRKDSVILVGQVAQQRYADGRRGNKTERTG
jgi:hypothetical protein